MQFVIVPKQETPIDKKQFLHMCRKPLEQLSEWKVGYSFSYEQTPYLSVKAHVSDAVGHGVWGGLADVERHQGLLLLQ